MVIESDSVRKLNHCALRIAQVPSMRMHLNLCNICQSYKINSCKSFVIILDVFLTHMQAFAAAKFAEACMRGLQGEAGVVECAFVQSVVSLHNFHALFYALGLHPATCLQPHKDLVCHR